ncbi:hypothetical protein F5B19DRAFT_443723 [Rostrohypoxylon terebratum]|nr:hypothetical protein F5B19DRAFT_443723 [Rostrohypoxylon terebratum]
MMPVFQVDLERRESAEQPTSPTMSTMASQSIQAKIYEDGALRKKRSEESIRTELCEGPILEDNPAPQTPERNPPTECSDRSELIERLKRGESPTWKPNRHFESIWGQQPGTPTRNPKRSSAGSPTLLPPVTITPEKKSPDSDDEKRRQEGLSIERPRSALHSGDFTQDEVSRDATTVQENQQAPERQNFGHVGEPWFGIATSPPRDFFETRDSLTRRLLIEASSLGSLSSLSSSIASNFYKPPTSPLVQSESNEDIDLTSPIEVIDIRSSLPRDSRRHTFMSPHSASYGMPHSPSPMQSSHLRQERSYPYQAHQPRRSLASTPNFPTASSSPQSPALSRSRRPSYSSDVSPIQHASMVGSYEESILRGRMSTTPSKPLDFLAQIGVLGLGKCKSSLRCPPHVTLPFPAVFYSYGSSSHSKVEDGPSPYVGQIDLENGLSAQEDDSRFKRKIQSRIQERLSTEDDGAEPNRRSVEPSDRDTRRAQRPKRRSNSPRAPPGGSYRIPEKGQIQIIIKNPNKTAVKLFLVPYDLAGMEPGTKTFIRQRSYSAGPIIENMPVKDNGTGDRPILRYLAHLHICCPSRGRYYLYKSIRVVFANRVPDGKEKLRNEITLPEPRFTSYKSIRVMHPPITGGTGPGASLAADKAFRRRSSGFYFGGPNQQAYDVAPGFQSDSCDLARLKTLVKPVPRVRNATRNTIDEGSNLGFSDPQSPNSSQTSRPNTQNSNDMSSWESLDGQINRYDKLNKGDVGYGGNAFARLINRNTGVAESLLSQRLRSLGVEGQDQDQSQSQSQTPGQADQESDAMQE